ncbi:MAG: hypothetical protein AMJ55_09955 [Gammaproteobacteria bacterium SG8_15]|nr:MAG: hypothetical protein AMJ55_09955 [Gammaproteobacteria bacterium SG8_15]
MAEETDTNKDLKQNYTVKDKWDKLEIMLHPIGGFFTGLAIAALGYFGSAALEERQTNEINMRLYSELMNQREQAENKLRSDMFKQIFDSFLAKSVKDSSETKTPHGEEYIYDLETNLEIARDKKDREKVRIFSNLLLKRINNDLLRLELLTRNFHESIDIKPIFREILFKILHVRRSLKPFITNTENKATDSKHQHELAKLYKETRKKINNLRDIAYRISDKQIENLANEGNYAIIAIDTNNVCNNKSRPPEAPETIPEGCEGIKGYSDVVMLTMQANDREYQRIFRINVKHAYTQWSQVYVEVQATKPNEDVTCKEKENDDIHNMCANFWVSSFDFPLVDNTYLSEEERYGVAIDSIDEDTNKVNLVLVYFPASYSGLKEKSFYHKKVLNHLDNWSVITGDD